MLQRLCYAVTMYEQIKDKISVKQACRILSVKPDTVYHHIEKGHYKRIDNAGNIDGKSFVAYLANNYRHYKDLADRYEKIYRRLVKK